jgi:hypothetical protein
MLAWNSVNQFGIPSGTYSENQSIPGGGTVLYIGQNEFYNHTGLNGADTYYYKAWSVDPSVIYSSGVLDSATTQFPEPTDHPTGLAAASNGPNQITVSWTDSDASHYLVKGSVVGYANIVPPVDGVGQSDSLLVKNIDAMSQQAVFTGLNFSTTYYFKVYPYNGAGESSNYKTNGTVPEASATTDDLGIDLIISEVVDPADKPFAKYLEVMNTGETTIDFSATPIYLCKQTQTLTWFSVQLTGTIAPGGCHVIASSDTSFTANYGFPASQLNSNINGNGDDGYYLFYNGNQSTGTLIDSYGVIGQAGTGQPWYYENSHAVRKRTVTTPTSAWNANEWVIMSAGVKAMTPLYHKGTINWLGALSTNWNEKGQNWDNAFGYIPDASCNVIIPFTDIVNFPIITEPSACHELELLNDGSNGASLSIQSTGSLLIVGP